jgi:hypothetical protein
MKTRISLLLLVLVMVFGLAGCGGSSPTATVKNFYKYIERGQYEKAASLISSSAINTYGIDKLVSVLQMQSQQIQQSGGITSFKVTDQTIINDNAVVYFEITTGDGAVSPGSVNLVKEDGDWKIDLGK